MPLASVKFAPGVNSEVTDVQGVAQITSSNLIRFKYAGTEVLPEKLGGWAKFYPVGLGSVPRALHAWEGLNGDTHLAVGCTGSLAIITDGVGLDATPRTARTNPTVSFSTTNASPIVSIDDAGFTATVYDSIYLLTPVAVGGLILQGAYQVTAVIDADTYQITASSNATATVAAGGAVPSFAVTNGSPTIIVTLVAHGLAVGETFNVPASTAATVGGIVISGAYLVQTVPTANTFTIIAQTAATSSTSGSMNAGKAGIVYYVSIGPSPPYGGYGSGTYGTGTYGLGSTPPASVGTPITTTNWTLDHWGEVLLACPTDGPVYAYSPDSGFSVAVRILDAPEINGGIFVSQPAQILVAWASSVGGVQDPLTVNWSDAGDYTNWTVSSQTQAGGYRLPTGSKIVGGVAGPNFGILWTDVDVWAMDYIEVPLVFGFNNLGSNCGMIGRHATATLNSTVYWMSQNKFCLLNGETVQTIPCTVWDFVFQDIDMTVTDKFFAASNSLFNEVAFYFASASGGTGEIDSYVKYNVDTQVWDEGRLDRTAWVDQSPVGQPIGGASNGFIYQHEVSPDADGQPMNSWFKTGYFSVGDGENLMFVDWILPDFKWGYSGGSQGAVVQMTLSTTDYPNGAVKSQGPYSVTDQITFVNTRLRGRFMALQIASNDLGSFWRLGGIKIRSAPDGKQ